MLAIIDRIPLNPFDFAIFVLYMIVTVAVGFWVAGRARKTTSGYFLGDKKLPWYVVGTSMIAADISSDDLIANAGGAYQYGMVVGAGSWNAWIIYTLLIWIFLPYYVRSGIYTMPQFLERRYNSACRYLRLLPRRWLHRRHPRRHALCRWLVAPEHARHGPDDRDLVFRDHDRRLHDLRRAHLRRVDGLFAGLPAADRRNPGPGARPLSHRQDPGPRRREPAEIPRLPPADARALPGDRRLHRLPHRRNLVLVHQSAHGPARARRQGRMARAHGRRRRGVSAHHHAAVLCSARRDRLQNVPELAAAGHGVPGAGQDAHSDRAARLDPRGHGGGADEQRLVGAEQRLDADDDGPVQENARGVDGAARAAG